MLKLTLAEIATATGATLIGATNPNDFITAVETDSRRSVEGKLFVALKGERFDAHEFVSQATASGACAVMVDHDCGVKIPQLVVKNTEIGLGLLGRLNREKSKATVVSVTGTCGKTSVKEMTAAILQLCGPTIATAGNLNNAIGVPLTLLNIGADTQFAVVELGASHPKDIEYGVELARPVAGLINNVGGAHLLGFGSLDGVYKTKSEILDFVQAHKGQGIVNADSEFFTRWQQEYPQVKSFSALGKKEADVFATSVQPLADGCFAFVLNTKVGASKVTLGVPGVHNVSNALAAASLALAAGAGLDQIVAGLNSVRPVKGRLFVEKYGAATLIDDAYNASVTAVKASLDTLSTLPGYHVFVFGDMGELGAQAEDLHREVGAYGQGRAQQFLTVGVLAKLSSEAFNAGCSPEALGRSFADKAALEAYLDELLTAHPDACIAVKGAHFMRMDEVAQHLRQKLQ